MEDDNARNPYAAWISADRDLQAAAALPNDAEHALRAALPPDDVRRGSARCLAAISADGPPVRERYKIEPDHCRHSQTVVTLPALHP